MIKIDFENCYHLMQCKTKSAILQSKGSLPPQKRNFMKKFHKTATPPRTAFMKSLFRITRIRDTTRFATKARI